MPNRINTIYHLNKRFLTEQECIWFVCHILIERDTYQTEILGEILNYKRHITSVHIVNRVLNTLIKLKLVSTYYEHKEGRGKARKMYKLTDHAWAVAKDWSKLWLNFVGDDNGIDK